jgi:O-antigen ligase
MSTPQVALAAPAPAAAPHPRRERSAWRVHPVLTTVTFLTPLSIALSAFEGARIPVGGLLMHPFLLPAGALFATVAIPRLGRFPGRILVAMFLFVAFFTVSMLQGGDGLAGEFVKLASLFVTILAMGAAVLVIKDSRPAALGLAIGIALMSVNGLRQIGSSISINPVEVANKNAYSIYALPALLVAAVFLFQRTSLSRVARALMTLSALVIAWTVFSTGNRSGWVGVILIVLIVALRGAGLRKRITLVVLVLAGYVLVSRISGTEIIEQRVEVTENGYSSDTKREDLVITAIQIGIENPLLGISPLLLSRALAHRMHEPAPIVDPHNTIGYIVGGAGMLTFMAFIFLGWTLCTSRPASRGRPLSPGARQALSLLRNLTILFVFRGMFSRELLYNPAFATAYGLALGEALIHGLWRPMRRSSAPELMTKAIS